MPPRQRKTADESLEEGVEHAEQLDSPVLAEIATLRADIESLIPMREEMASIGKTLDRLSAREPTVFDADGFVVGHTVLVESVFPGDLIATGMAGFDALPLIYRCIDGRLRNEFGMSYPAAQIPKPWRLLWRSPVNALPVDKPKKAKKGEPVEESDDAEV